MKKIFLSALFISFVTIYCAHAQVPVTPLSISGSTVVCPGTTHIYSIDTVAGATSYTWTLPGGWTGTSASDTIHATAGSSGGTISVTANNSFGSSAPQTLSVVVNNVSATTTKTDATCFGICNGTATCLPVGTGPFTYLWMPGGQTTATVTGLCAGAYMVTVTGAGGCSTTATAVISQPAALILSETHMNSFCNSAGTCTGSISLSATGGTPPYTFSGAAAFGVCLGTHPISVTDAHGCTASGFVNIIGPAPLVGSETHTDAICHGSCDGTVTLSASGGVPPYSFSGGPFTGLCAGKHVFMVTDGVGCVTNIIMDINEPPVLRINASHTNVTCNGACDGTMSLSASGGTPPYTFSGGLFTDLCTGTYLLTVTDAHGCTKDTSVTITQPPVLSVSTTTTAASCNGSCDGTATAIITGGTPGYSVAWCNGSTIPAITGVCAGSCTITVVDFNGCVATANAVVSEPSPISLAVSATPNPICTGGCAALNVVSTGGTPGYIFNWVPAIYLNSTTIPDPIACPPSTMSYTITVTDMNGCITSDLVTVTVNPLPTVSYIQTPSIFCNSVSSVTLTAGSPAGGSYSGTTVSGNTFSPATAGTGSYLIDYMYTDVNGCSNTASSTITVSACTGIEQQPFDAGQLVIYPNPAHDVITITGIKESSEIIIFNAIGQEILHTLILKDKTDLDLGELSNGVYLIKIQTGGNVITKKIIKE